MLKCNKCGCESSCVIDSRPGLGNMVRRRRVCENCGNRYSTIEITEDEYKKLRHVAELIYAIVDYAKEGGTSI